MVLEMVVSAPAETTSAMRDQTCILLWVNSSVSRVLISFIICFLPCWALLNLLLKANVLVPGVYHLLTAVGPVWPIYLRHQRVNHSIISCEPPHSFPPPPHEPDSHR